MTRKVERLTLDNLAQLPGHCPSCVFWELDPVRREQIRGHEAEEKAAWVSMMLREWGSIGRVLFIDGVPVGHLLWAPARFLPGGDTFATAPVSSDAILLAGGYLDPEHRGQGLGRVLVQAMAKDLIRHGGIGAVETFGAKRPARDVCALPVGFLLAVGFKTHRQHPSYPRMRMDLKTTVTWREELETAAEKILGVVKRPSPQLGGTTRTTRSDSVSGGRRPGPSGAR